MDETDKIYKPFDLTSYAYCAQSRSKELMSQLGFTIYAWKKLQQSLNQKQQASQLRITARLVVNIPSSCLKVRIKIFCCLHTLVIFVKVKATSTLRYIFDTIHSAALSLPVWSGRLAGPTWQAPTYSFQKVLNAHCSVVRACLPPWSPIPHNQ